MKTQRIFWLALYFLIPSILIGLIFSSPFSPFGDPLYNLSAVTGALAFTWLVNQLIISARPKFIERHFGMDRMYRFHAWMAVVCLGLLVVHRQSKLAWAGFAPTAALLAAILFILAVVFALIFLADTRLRNLKFVCDLVAFADQKLGLTFNRVVLFHNLTVIASILMALHVLGTSTAQVHRPVRIFYFVYFGLGASFYLYHKFFRPWWLARRAYRVAAVVAELPNLRTLRLTPPESQPVFTYQPGQFAFITPLRGPVKREEHPFTISSTPVDREAITFTIKALGDFTASLKQIEPGTPVRVDAPYGVFSYRHHPKGQPLGLIAGGIGITPMLSMLRTLRATEPERQVTFLWGVNLPEELFCQDELNAMGAKMPNFTWHPVIASRATGVDETWPGEQGFVDREKIERLMLNNHPNSSEIDFYVCGPKVMMNLVTGHLKDAGVPGKRIRMEKFAF
jgi:predicted ferric reductase